MYRIRPIFRSSNCHPFFLPPSSSLFPIQSVGKDLLESQRMEKKHGVLEQEIQGHKSQLDSTLAAGAQLLADKHFASAVIEAKCEDLKADWKNLGEATAERRKLLDLNLDVHQFFHDATEVEGKRGS